MQNFDPEWAKHLKHDPDKPLAVNVPTPSITWESCKQSVVDIAHQAAGWTPLSHDAKTRPPGAMEASTRWLSVKLHIRGSGEELDLPCQQAATAQELAEHLSGKLGIPAGDISFVYKQGPLYKVKYAHDQVSPVMTVRGVKSLKRERAMPQHPRAIIGAGHIGLRMAMFLVERQEFDFIVFDRMNRVGGTSWMYQANSTSKLQTEYGAYHLNYGANYELPLDFTTPWPSRNALLDHFQKHANEQGIMPYIRLETNIKGMNVLPDSSGNETSHYELTAEKMEAGMLEYGRLVGNASSEEVAISVHSICMFPGNLTLPRQETYAGEDIFDGDIGYAMFNEIDYHKLQGKDVTIVGHGAFAVENIRTCCEFDVNQIYLVCRRTNLSCPRVASWMANRSLSPLTNARFMKVMEPMYELIGRDPWAYHSVSANSAKTTCQITQKARFGIGDIYFLSIYMGKVEVIIEKGVKRLSQHTVHLESGRKLSCHAILKLLGLVGEMENDRLLKIKEMVGFWVNGDPRRYIVSEPVSVMSTSMGGTSLSPGAYSWSLEGLYFIDFPEDFKKGPLGSGMLPRNKVDLSDDGTPRPAYVVDARHGTQTAMTIMMYTPGIQQLEANGGAIKAVRYRLCHPISKFLAQAKEDWDYYAKKMLDGGFGKDKPYPEYPYNPNTVIDMYRQHMNESGEPELPCDAADISLCASIGFCA